MKLLVDMNLSPRWIGVLADSGIEAAHWSTLGKSNAADAEIMQYARNNDYVVLTHDLDFGAILALNLLTRPSVIIFRLSDESAASVNSRLDVVIREQVTALQDGALVLVEDSRYRVRALPISR